VKLYNGKNEQRGKKRRMISDEKKAKCHRSCLIELLNVNNQQAVFSMGKHDIGNML
jgi:CRISPR/Cas system-associated protein Cas7 (RAMP superfamily)